MTPLRGLTKKNLQIILYNMKPAELICMYTLSRRMRRAVKKSIRFRHRVHRHPFEVLLIYDDDGFKLLINEHYNQRQATTMTMSFHRRSEVENETDLRPWRFRRDLVLPVIYDPSSRHVRIYQHNPDTPGAFLSLTRLFAINRRPWYAAISIYFKVDTNLERYMNGLNWLARIPSERLDGNLHVIRVEGRLLEHNHFAYHQILRIIHSPERLELLSGPGRCFELEPDELSGRVLATEYVEIEDARWMSYPMVERLIDDLEVVRLRDLLFTHTDHESCVQRWKSSKRMRRLELHDDFTGGVYSDIETAAHVWTVPEQHLGQFQHFLDLHPPPRNDRFIGTLRMYPNRAAGLILAIGHTFQIYTVWPLGPILVHKLHEIPARPGQHNDMFLPDRRLNPQFYNL